MLLKCDNCDTKLVGEFCHICGQSGRPVQNSFKGFLHDLFTNLLGTDSRIVQSLRGLVLSPGRLTKDWVEGHRNRYTSPIQLYLLMASGFFLLNAYHPFIQFTPDDHTIFSSLTGARIEVPLSETHLANLESAAVSLEVYRERFDTRVSAALGPLLIMTVVLFSCFVGAMTRRGRPFAHHAVFSLHWCSFFLLIESIRRLVGGGKIGEIVTVAIGGVYLIVAIARVYGSWKRALFVGPVLVFGFLFLIAGWMAATLWVALP